MSDYTPNYHFALPDFNQRFWHDEMKRLLNGFDTVINKYASLGNVAGVWSNSTAYVVGEHLVDEQIGNLYECAVSHTSAATGTYAADRIARPSYWINSSVTNRFRGAWTTATIYRTGDFVVSGNKYAIATQQFTSGASFASDETAGKFTSLIDLAAIPASVVPVPNISTALYYARQTVAGDAYEVVPISTIYSALGLGALAAFNTLNGSLIDAGSVADAKMTTPITRLTAGTPLVMNPWALNQSLTQAHGLGVVPFQTIQTLECLSADNGHAAGVTMFVSPTAVNSGAVVSHMTSFDATNLYLRTNTGSTTTILNTSNVSINLTAAKWKLTVTPYKLA